MLGYEVQETLSEITYNTHWFNLSDVFGIDSIKYREANGSTKAAFFVNGSSDEWAAKKVGGISAKMLSRRFDIEFRVQYVYSYDPVTEVYTEHKVEVPMLFVQEENFDTLIADVGSTNGIIIALLVNSDDISKILSDYDTLIPAYIENKGLITVDLILAYIGEKKVNE